MEDCTVICLYPNKSELARCRQDFDENAGRNECCMITFTNNFVARHGQEAAALMLAYTVYTHIHDANYTKAVCQWACSKLAMPAALAPASAQAESRFASHARPTLVKRAAQIVMELERAQSREARQKWNKAR